VKTCSKGLHQYEPVPGSNRGCPECYKNAQINYRRECGAASGRKWREKNRDKHREKVRIWTAKNPDKAKEKNRRSIDNMLDGYIKTLILEVKNPPQDLIEAKKAEIKLKRLIREMKK
jgi:hypothetical protein